MQPYVGTSAGIEIVARPVRQEAVRTDRLRDLLCVLIILNAWAILLFLVPPQHEYPVVDDWIYAGSVRDTLNTGVFTMPDWSQANLVGQVMWGVAWSKVFGFSFTTLTFSVIFLAVAGVVAFYGILRVLDVPPWGALLGAFMFGFNPIYVHLTYSFMTDVPFLALTLVSCFFLLKGVRAEGDVPGALWLVLGVVVAVWAFLIRQFAIVVPIAFILYLIGYAITTRRAVWRRALPMVAAFVILMGLWYLWAKSQSTTAFQAMANGRADAFLFKPVWPRVILVRWLTYIPFVALFAATAVKMRSRSWLIVPVVLVAMLAAMYLVKQEPEVAAAQLEPPFTAQLGPLSIDFPQDEYTYGLWGSVVRPVGLDFDEFGYTEQQIWSPEAWRVLWLVSVVVGAIFVTKAIDVMLGWRWKGRLRETLRRRLPPSLAFYMVGAGIFLITTAYLGDVYLRYALAIMPFAIFFMVSRSAIWGRIAWGIAVVGLVVLIAFTVLAKADNVEHNNVRWEAGRWMESRVGAVRVGWNWDHWGHQDSDNYIITDVHQDGYRTERVFPYTSRLSGFTTRYVLAESRVTMPPLPAQPASP